VNSFTDYDKFACHVYPPDKSRFAGYTEKQAWPAFPAAFPETRQIPGKA
jgi:hypothetical protein